MFPLFLMSDEMIAAQNRRNEEVRQRRLAKCVPWSADMKWAPELNIQASTYKTFSLFDVAPLTSNDVNLAKAENLAVSPNEKWCYCDKLLPTGGTLYTFSGSRRGSVMFDGPVSFPSLHQRCHSVPRWQEAPWMSLTPMEVFTLRIGTKKARGSVVVAGLGLGHQLIEVSRRKQVTKLILVEKEQELVDWLFPKIQPMLGCPVDIVIGDAYAELPKLEANIALIDIFRHYGNNNMARERFMQVCRNIQDVWVWGGAKIA